MPVIADANSMTYVLHKKLGDDIVITRDGRAITAAARGGTRRQHLPERADHGGRRFRKAVQRSGRLPALSGRDGTGEPRRLQAQSKRAQEILAQMPCSRPSAWPQFHRVENTYISTFQTLGGLGLARRHDRSRRGAVAKRPGTPPRTGSAWRGRLSREPRLRHRACGERPAARMGSGHWNGLRARRRVAGARGARRMAAGGDGSVVVVGCGLREWTAIFDACHAGRAAERRCSER